MEYVPNQKRAKTAPTGDPTDLSFVSATPATLDAMSEAPTRVASIQESLSTLGDEVALELYTSQDSGAAQTLEYRKFLQAEGAPASYWHDVPLRTPSGAMRAVIEITRETRAKMEIATDEAGTPIKQDVKKGKLRDYNIPIKWNYGALPQTWEQPDHVWEGLEGHAGDNDPVDVVDVSAIPVGCGAIIEFKPITALAMIDEGEVDWKVIGINTADPKAAGINCLADLEASFPGEVDSIREWFTWYKAVDENGNKVDGKDPNVFGFDGKPLATEEALDVINAGNHCWNALVTRKIPRPPKLKLA